MPDNSPKRKPSLPSPPSSGTLPKSKLGISLSEGGRRTPDGRQRPQHLPTSYHIDTSAGKKRRRQTGERESRQSEEPCCKRARQDIGRGQQQGLYSRTGDAEAQDPIQCWLKTVHRSEGFGDMSEPESDGSNKRRRPSTPSYSSRAGDGSVPPAHTAAYEEQLQRYGIMFDDWATVNEVNAESKDMCRSLLGQERLPPAYNSSSEATYMKLFHRASKCNEERVRRDLTPHIVPSAELLYVLDGEAALENVREEMSVDWTKCGLLGGTQPRPDYAYGLSSATFTEEELSKLENYTNVNNPTKFTESMYFPFLVCEAKCGKKNINDADRQNVHSASIAVNAIIQLCRAGGEDCARSLSGQILVFSISHDNERVKIYGHFPLIRDGRTTFHRYYIHNYSLDGHYGRDRNTGSDFTRAVYRDFYPSHVERIQQAIAYLADPQPTPVGFDVSVGGDEMQTSEQSSQERPSSSRPSLRRTKSRGSQGELILMKQQMAMLEKMCNTQLEQQQKQMEQQREDSRKQLEQQQKQMEQQQKQIEQQQKQMEQQKEDSRKQMEQQQKLLERLLDQGESK